jgi:hypothetical protein
MYYLRLGSDGLVWWHCHSFIVHVVVWYQPLYSVLCICGFPAATIVVLLFGVTSQPTETNLIQQSTTIDTEKEKESEEIGMED